MKITNIENETIFDLKYTILVFQTYNEEFFKSKGIDATVSIVIDKEELMKGGRSHKIDIDKEDKVMAVPYRYFDDAAKYIVKLIVGTANEGYSAFVEVFKRMPILSNYVKKEPLKLPDLPGTPPKEEEEKKEEEEEKKEEEETHDSVEEPSLVLEPQPSKIPEAVIEEEVIKPEKEPEPIAPPVVEEKEEPEVVAKEASRPAVVEEKEEPEVVEPVAESVVEKIVEKQSEPVAEPVSPKPELVHLTPMPEEVKKTLLEPSETKILRIKVMTSDVHEINKDELFYPKLERCLQLGIFGKEFSIEGRNVIIGEESIMCMNPDLLKKIYGTKVYKTITDGECKPLL